MATQPTTAPPATSALVPVGEQGVAARADIRAQRRFAAMIDARDFHGRPALLYTEAERLLDAVGAPRPRYVDVPAQFGDERDEPAGDNPWASGYGHESGGTL